MPKYVKSYNLNKTGQDAENKKLFNPDSNLFKADVKKKLDHRSIIFIVCTIGLAWHLIVTTSIYLSYELVTLTSTQLESVITPPLLNVCIRLEDFHPYFPKNCTRKVLVSGRKVNCVIEQYSLQMLMNNYSGAMIENTYFYNYDDYRIDNFASSSYYDMFPGFLLEYYFLKSKCIQIPTLLNVRNGKVIYDTIIGNRSNDINFSLDKKHLESQDMEEIFLLDTFLGVQHSIGHGKWIDVAIFLTDSTNRVPHHRDQTYLHNFYDSSKTADDVSKISYYEVVTRYMTYPYGHDCYDNSNKVINETFESRGDCIEKCTNEGLLKKYGSVGRVMSTTEYDTYIPFNAPTYDEHIDRMCNSKCKVHCLTKQYFPIQLLLWNHFRHDKLRIQLLYMYPQTSVMFAAKFDLLSYFIFIGGICGIWVGLDLFSCATYFILCLNKLHTKMIRNGSKM